MADNAVLELTEVIPLGVNGAHAPLSVELVNSCAHEPAQIRLQKMAAKLALAHRSKSDPVFYAPVQCMAVGQNGVDGPHALKPVEPVLKSVLEAAQIQNQNMAGDFALA